MIVETKSVGLAYILKRLKSAGTGMKLASGDLPRSGLCAKCGQRLQVARYLEENCTFYYELACPKGDSGSNIIQVARPLKPGYTCPNCLIGRMKQLPTLEKGMRLSCDSCLGVIPFGYAVTRKVS